MRSLRTPLMSGIVASATGAVLLLGAVPAQAATITTSDQGSSISMKSPISVPPLSKCKKITVTYDLKDDVDYATAAILDAKGAMVARSVELAPGTGTATLPLCGATLSGKNSPFALQLMITYTEDSGKGAATPSTTFDFTSKPITCKKAKAPNKGQTKKVTVGACPVGWKQA